MSLLYNTFDTLLDPVFIINQDKEVVYANEAAAILTGLSLRKILNKKPKLQEMIFFASESDFLNQFIGIQEPTAYKEVSFKSTNTESSGVLQLTAQPSPIQPNEYIVFIKDFTLEERLQKKYRSQLEQKESVIEDLKKAKIELENYSKNLESMVQERTLEISRINITLQSLLDSLNEGFFIFQSNGDILPVFSKACLKILEKNPLGKKVWDLLNLSTEDSLIFQKWTKAIFAELLPFEDLVPLGPTHYKHSQGATISLDYYPFKNSEDQLSGIVVVAQDISDLVIAQKNAELERANVEKILNILRRKKEISVFVSDVEQFLQNAQNNIQSKNFDKDEMFRCLHTIKGGAATFGLKLIADLCHEAENILANNKELEHNIPFLKEYLNKIQVEFNAFIKETQDTFGDKIFAKEKLIEIPLQELTPLLFSPDSSSSDLIYKNTLINKYLLIKIENLFVNYQDTIQNLSEKLEKPMRPIVFKNGNILVWEHFYQGFGSACVHIFRNIMDHGIEQKEERLQQGKQAEGQITITFVKEQNHLKIQIEDDGKGLNLRKIKEKLQQRQIDFSNWSDFKIQQSIFLPSFSTQNHITELSGRGVGMDAVAQVIKDLKGDYRVESQENKYTRFVFSLPYVNHPLLLKNIDLKAS